MAKMLPATVAEGTSSPAEHAMFAHIRDELSSEWIVLHSLGLTIHHAKPWAEIDFVLIGPPGVICLEVKGGLVSRRDGIWYTTPARPPCRPAAKLHESPFEQVGSASAQLFKFIQRACPEAAKAITGYAVAAPDVEWTVRGPDIDLALVYDQRDCVRPFADFLDRVIRRWNERLGGPTGRKSRRSADTASRPCSKASAATSILSRHSAPAPKTPTANSYASPTSSVSFSPDSARTLGLSHEEVPVPERRSSRPKRQGAWPDRASECLVSMLQPQPSTIYRTRPRRYSRDHRADPSLADEGPCGYRRPQFRAARCRRE